MSHTRPERPARSTSRFSGVTRVGFRVVAVAGLAGAAWALSASAANAADAPDAASVSNQPGVNVATRPVASPAVSLLGDVATGTLRTLIGGRGAATALDTTPAPVSAVSRSAAPVSAVSRSTARPTTATSITDTVLTPVKGVLTTTAAPLVGLTSTVLAEVLTPTNTVLAKGTAVSTDPVGAIGNTASADAPRHTAGAPAVRGASDVVSGDATNQVASSQPGAPDVLASNGAAYVGSADLVRTVSDIVAPLGLTDLVQTPFDVLRPMIGMADPVLAPLASVLRPVTAAARWLATPVTGTLGTLTRRATTLAMCSTVDAPIEATAPATMSQPTAAPPTPSADVTWAVDAATIAMTPVRVEAGTSAQRAYHRTGTRGTPVSRHRTDRVGARNLPANPAPLPAPSGPDLGAISTTTSGSHENGGASATLSNPVATSLVAHHGLLAATGVVARRLIVEVPTVSPD